jgi:hypothetical protein
MKHWCFYDATTGLFDGGSVGLPDDVDPGPNTPAGHIAIEGSFDAKSQRFDLATNTVAPYTPPVDADAEARSVRAARDLMLAQCDWTQVADAPISAEMLASWRTYRQALRDVPEQSGFPQTVTWPTAPEEMK